MKLHLPVPLRSAILLCLSAFSTLPFTLGAGALTPGLVAISLVVPQAEGAVVDKTFEYDGTTYSGAELVTLDVSNAANVERGGSSHAISYVRDMTVTLEIDGTLTDKMMTDSVHALNSTAYSSDNYNYEIWKSFCGSRGVYGYGQTIKLTGADTAWNLTFDFTPIDFGGLITEASTDSGSYTIGRSSSNYGKTSALNITANSTAGANMLINAETTLVGSISSVNTSGTWVLNKSLTFAQSTTIAANQELNLSGEGALNIGGSLYLNRDARIVGENNDINADDLDLDLSGLTSGAAALISTGGAVEVNRLNFFNYSNLDAGEYVLISTTDASADAIASLYTNGDRYSVFSRNGLVLLTVREASYGGAIYNDCAFTLSGNDNVNYSENRASCGGAIYNDGGNAIFSLSENGKVAFTGNCVSDIGGDIFSCGGAIYNGDDATFTLSDNGNVTFSGNSASSDGGAICNDGTFTLCGNENVSFSENTANAGGAICNYGTFTLCGNENVSFSGNSASYSSYYGGAICNGHEATFTLSDNGNVTFSGNSASAYGGAIYNYGTFTLSGNGDVTFSGNSSAFAVGGAICNDGTFTLCGNGDVLFEKNAEIRNGTYHLRSIYSMGTLSLSAAEGKKILFKDSVYADGKVNLNQDGTGDIIFSGASTAADLFEVKGGVDGTAEEILNSRTSEFATNATLYGGRLIVEDGAILKGQGITITEGANATIRLNGGTLDETGCSIAVTSGSGLEFAGENVLNADSVQMADGTFLSFVMGEGGGTKCDAQLITGQLNVQLSGDLFNGHQLLTLKDASQYDTASWTRDAISVSGATFDSLSWNEGVLTYTPHLIITPSEDGALDDVLPNDGNAIIDGSGHSLTVKNSVQLVQMALKDGIVKLEGANNNIVSVMLTEGGELVLAAGAGLTTGDIISMVANGSAELLVSGDITIDNKGMKGKENFPASMSHADVKVLGDASISNVRVEDSTIDLAGGSTVHFENVVLTSSARITDEPATVLLDQVTAELVMGENTVMIGSKELPVGTSLMQTGNSDVILTLTDKATVLLLEADTFDSVTLSGNSLVLELTEMPDDVLGMADYIRVSFTSGTGFATFDKSLTVTLGINGAYYATGYMATEADRAAIIYFATPEPTTTTLSLLALATFAARRKRK